VPVTKVVSLPSMAVSVPFTLLYPDQNCSAGVCVCVCVCVVWCVCILGRVKGCAQVVELSLVMQLKWSAGMKLNCSVCKSSSSPLHGQLPIPCKAMCPTKTGTVTCHAIELQCIARAATHPCTVNFLSPAKQCVLQRQGLSLVMQLKCSVLREQHLTPAW